MLSLYYHKLMGKIKENEGKIYLMISNCVLHKVSDRIKK